MVSWKHDHAKHFLTRLLSNQRQSCKLNEPSPTLESYQLLRNPTLEEPIVSGLPHTLKFTPLTAVTSFSASMLWSASVPCVFCFLLQNHQPYQENCPPLQGEKKNKHRRKPTQGYISTPCRLHLRLMGSR